MLILVNELHFANAPESNFFMLVDNLTFDNELQPSKAFSPIVVTVSGNSIFSRFVQPEKAFSPIVVTESGIVIVTIPVQPVNMLPGICFIPFSNNTSFKLSHFANGPYAVFK